MEKNNNLCTEKITGRLEELKKQRGADSERLDQCKQEMNILTTKIISVNGAILELEKLLSGTSSGV